MSRLKRVTAGILALLHKNQEERDLDDELRGYVEIATERKIQTGLKPEMAARAARVDMGSLEATKDRVRDAGLEAQFQTLWHDARMALRSVLRDRGYFTLGVATTTLAVGANVLVFTIVNALWLRPRPVAAPDRLVVIMRDLKSADGFALAPYGFKLLADSPAFSGVAGQDVTTGANAAVRSRVVISEVGHEVETLGVSPEYFSVLGVHILGRPFLRGDYAAGVPSAIISDQLWRTALGSRPDVVGAMVEASPRPLQVVGVAPPGFRGARLGESIDIWLPRQGAMLAICRLRDGVTFAAAESFLSQAGFHTPLHAVPLSRVFGASDRRMIVVDEGSTMGVVSVTAALVLFSGCATLMGLVLVRYERRRPELAIRLALGGSRGRLVRQLALELTVLAVVGTAGALVAATWCVRALPSLSLSNGVRLDRLDLTIDWRVTSAAAGAMLLTVAIAATLPLVRFTGASVAASLVTATATGSLAAIRLRRAILCAHVAATVIVLVTAGLFVRSVSYGSSIGPGFDTESTLFARVHSSDVGPPPSPEMSAALSARRGAANRDVIEQLASTPGVDSVAIGSAPIGAEKERELSGPRTILVDKEARDLSFGWSSGGPGFLAALGVPMTLGRSFNEMSERASGREAVVTASMAELLWPGDSPLGHHISLGRNEHGAVPEFTVVGVVDTAYASVRFGRPAAVFTDDYPASGEQPDLPLIVRTKNPLSIRSQVKQIVEHAFPDTARVSVVTGQELLEEDLGPERLGAWFFSGFGFVAMGLGIGAVFGLVSYLAETRRREFGVRIALGATRANVMGNAIWVGLAPTALGASIGLIVSMLLARTLEAYLLGLPGVDFPTYVGAFVLFVACAATAGLLAASRLRRISPMDALRVR